MSTRDPSSNFDDAWIQNVVSKNPFWLAPPGSPNEGNIRSCPVRLSFCEQLFDAKNNDDNEPVYQTTLLIPACADITLLRSEASRAALAEWPLLGQPGQLQVSNLHSPFKDQADKANQYEGYNPGAVFITASSKRRPAIVDMRGAPIVQKDKVYPGVWAFVTTRPFAYNYRDKRTGNVMKRGISFGLQSVMILVDDKQLGGGGGDPVNDFAGINVEGLAPDFNAAAGFGGPAAGAQPADPLAAAVAAQGAQPGVVF